MICTVVGQIRTNSSRPIRVEVELNKCIKVQCSKVLSVECSGKRKGDCERERGEEGEEEVSESRERVGEVVPPPIWGRYLIIAPTLGSHIACLRHGITTLCRISSSKMHDWLFGIHQHKVRP
jgi:hypothetical protein